MPPVNFFIAFVALDALVTEFYTLRELEVLILKKKNSFVAAQLLKDKRHSPRIS